jgi:hypothetical protein
LSKGEKRNRKRMAELGAVYDAAPVVRTPADILPDCGAKRAEVTAGPTASNKWLTASVVEQAASVVHAIFDEAERRDPNHTRAWVALVDGANHQIDRIRAEAKTRGVEVSIICDFTHVLERRPGGFYPEADPAAEAWVHHQALAVLDGKAIQVAGVIRRKATTSGLDRARRKSADEAASYLTKKARYLDYPTALDNGWPLATGVIEGACRHIVADRLDMTGARPRWGLEDAEAILIRALRSNKHSWAAWGAARSTSASSSPTRGRTPPSPGRSARESCASDDSAVAAPMSAASVWTTDPAPGSWCHRRSRAPHRRRGRAGTAPGRPRVDEHRAPHRVGGHGAQRAGGRRAVALARTSAPLRWMGGDGVRPRGVGCNAVRHRLSPSRRRRG